MTIEFRCTQCAKLLRTPDDTAGKQAKCPECGAIMQIPTAPPSAPPSATPSQPAVPGGAFVPPPPPPGTPQASSPFGPGGSSSAGNVNPANPYASPGQVDPTAGMYIGGLDPHAAQRLSGPGIGLIITGILGIGLRLTGMVVNLFFMGAGVMPQGMQPMQQPFAIGAISYTVEIVACVLGVVVVLGGVRMRNLESYSLSMTAAILAIIPCLSPCCVLGIPFGIWALVVLNDSAVKTAFKS